MTSPLQRVLDEGYLEDLTSIDIAELRERRVFCSKIETGLSYVRRLAQGRLDVVAAEQAVRTESGQVDALEDLIGRLPALLAAKTRSAGNGRLPSEFGTGDVDVELSSELDEIISAGRLTSLDELDDESLGRAVEALTEFERKVSGLRRQLFDRLDAIEAELTRRYRTGEASVDSLLH